MNCWIQAYSKILTWCYQHDIDVNQLIDKGLAVNKENKNKNIMYLEEEGIEPKVKIKTDIDRFLHKSGCVEISEQKLLDTLKNTQLPTLISNIQCIEEFIQKIDNDINDNDFYCIKVLWRGDNKLNSNSTDEVYDLESSMFTEEELIEYMKSLRVFYEKKLQELKSQYINVYRNILDNEKNK